MILAGEEDNTDSLPGYIVGREHNIKRAKETHYWASSHSSTISLIHFNL